MRTKDSTLQDEIKDSIKNSLKVNEDLKCNKTKKDEDASL